MIHMSTCLGIFFLVHSFLQLSNASSFFFFPIFGFFLESRVNTEKYGEISSGGIYRDTQGYS